MSQRKAYWEHLTDPRWQKKRLEILERDKWECRYCGNKERELHVHHKSYDRGKKPWEYENDRMITYCSICHEEIGLLSKRLGELASDPEFRLTCQRFAEMMDTPGSECICSIILSIWHHSALWPQYADMISAACSGMSSAYELGQKQSNQTSAIYGDTTIRSEPEPSPAIT